jgi:hypothetical protein
MPVTITAGITFSGGGITTSFAPPVGATAGWFGGGYDLYYSTVDRITFATDTAIATVRGPLSTATTRNTGVNTFTYGWSAGGKVSGLPPQSTISRITYATDTATSTNRGPLTAGVYGAAGTTDNTTYGWITAGRAAAPGPISNIQRITYATDTATTSDRGFLGGYIPQRNLAGTGNTTYGWLVGGEPGNGVGRSTVARIVYATDTASTTNRGPLSGPKYNTAAIGNTNYGWVAGGFGDPPGGISTIDRIDFANDTATASVRGPLSSTRYSSGAVGNTDYGWIGGGNSPSKSSIVNRIDYVNDTVTVSTKGPLSLARYNMAGMSGVQ